MATLPRETSSSNTSPVILIFDIPNYADNFSAALEGFDIRRHDIETGIRFADADVAARQSGFYDLARMKPKPSRDRIIFGHQENACFNSGNIGPCFSYIYILKTNMNWAANNEPRSRYITNNDFWPMRRNELSTGEVNNLLRKPTLLSCCVLRESVNQAIAIVAIAVRAPPWSSRNLVILMKEKRAML
jgi:hypothetical protein